VAHWLGYLTGDGGVARHTADQPQRIQWAELHEGMASFLNTLTQKTFGKGVRIHPRKSAGGFYIYLDSSRIGRWLAANYPEAIRPGGPHRSAAALVCRSPNRVVARYLAGLFDAEGTVGQTRLEFRSTSFVLAQQVTLLLRRLSIQATFGRGRPKTSFTKRPLYRVVVSETSSVVRFAEQIGLGHPAKAERLAALVKRLREKPVRLIGACVLDVPVPANYLDDLLRQHKLPASVLPYYPGRRRPGQTVSRLLFGVWLRVLEELTGQLFPKLRVLLSFRWDRVKAVRALRGAKRVHDLRVPQFHNYVAGGLIVHNTANDISSLPPELLRKGRFDEIFFLDLPTLAERREIFAVHLQKRKRLAQDHDLDRLARESEGYVGAEIEQAIIDAMYAGFGAGREFTSDDVSAALKRQVPLSVSQRETIGALRAWLKEGRAQSASFQEAQEAEQQFVPLDLGNR
jgi:hypothetical protein